MSLATIRGKLIRSKMKPFLKTIILAIVLSLCRFRASGQLPFEEGVRLHDASGKDQKSKAFRFEGPYVLKWILNDNPPVDRIEKKWWKPMTQEGWKEAWLSVRVIDADKGEIISHRMISGRENYLAVSKGGNHYLEVSATSHCSWTIWGKGGIVRMTEKGPVLEQAMAQLNPKPVSQLKKPEQKPIIPVRPPAPSSVPGLPDGVEPAKKAVKPPSGMSPRN